MASRDRNLRYNISAETAGLERGMDRAKRAMEGYERSVEDAWNAVARLEQEQAREAERQAQRRSEAWQQAGRVMVTAGAAITGALVLAARAAVKWESDFAGVEKVLDGTPEQMAALNDQLRGLADTLPATHQEIAQTAQAAGQLGVAQQHIASFTVTMIGLGEATDMTADQAAFSMQRFSTIMGTPTRQVGNLASSLVDLGNNSAATESEIMQMATRIAGAGATIGLTEGEVMGFAAALTSVGVRAEAGGTAISRVMVNIAESVDAGGEKLEGFATVAGMSADEFATAFRDRPAQAIDAFITGLDGINRSGGDVFGTLNELGLSEVRVRDMLLRTAAAGDLVTESLDRGNDAYEENIALIEEVANRYGTKEAKLEMARNQMNNFAIDIGNVLLPVVGEAADRVGAWVAALGDAEDPLLAAGTWTAAAAGGVSLLAGAAILGVPKIAEFRGSLDAMGGRAASLNRGLGSVGNFLMGPWGIALGAGVLALGAWIDQKAQAEQQTREFTNALIADSGEIGTNTNQVLANVIAKEGLIDHAEQLGISTETLVGALLGEQEALEEIEPHLWAAERGVDGLTREQQENFAASRAMAEAIDGTNDSLVDALAEAQNYEDVLGVLEGTTGGADAATGEFGGSQEELAGLVGDTAGEIRTLRDELDELTGGTVDAITAEADFHDALRGVTDQIEEKGVETDVTTAKGKSLFDQVTRLRDRTYDYIDSMKDQGVESDKIMKKYEDMRSDLIDLMVQSGLTEDAAEDYIDTLLGTPDEIRTQIEVDARGNWTLQDAQMSGMSNSRGSFPSFAAGGEVWGPGTETSDSIPALLSRNEHVLPANEVRAAGGQRAIYAMRQLIKRGDLKFAGGGAVEPQRFARGGAVDVLPRSARVVNDHREDTRLKLQQMIVGLHDAIAGEVGKKVKEFIESGGKVVQATTRWAGTPYSWGGGSVHGPTRGFGRGAPYVGFDCSSLVQHGWYQGTGGRVHLPRTTFYQINAGRAVSGGRGSWLPGDLLFPQRGHVAMYVGGGRMFHTFRTGSTAQHAPAYGSPLAVRRPGRAFDRGGIWGHGETGVNLSGRDERVLDPRQTLAFERLVEGLTTRQVPVQRGGDGATQPAEVHYHVHHVPGYSTVQDLRRADEQRQRAARVGRPR